LANSWVKTWFFACKSLFSAVNNSCSEFLGLFEIKILISWRILIKISQLFSEITFSLLFSGDFGGSCGDFPINHLSMKNFSFGSLVLFQYKAVVRMLECPNTCVTFLNLLDKSQNNGVKYGVLIQYFY
jgi:hypothetical protein